jgi:hypothetical protein
MEDLDVELPSRVQLVANQQREVKKWTTREACTYFQKNKNKIGKILTYYCVGNNTLLVLLPNDGWMASNGIRYL